MAEPHILIEGLPAFTKKLWDTCSGRPFVLTAALKPYLIGIDEHCGPPHEQLIRRKFGGAHLVPEIAERNTDMAERTLELIRDTVALARECYRVGAGPVRAACVGSHQSLWYRAHAQVGRPNNLVTEEADGVALGRALARRLYVHYLHETFVSLGIEFDWLRDAFPHLPDLPDPGAEYQRLGRQAHELLDKHQGFKNLNGAVSFLFQRSATADWCLFDEPRGAGNKALGAPEEGERAYRRTDRLLEQYSHHIRSNVDEPFHNGVFTTKHPRVLDEPGYECVLVKILPSDPARYNRCDNPIITGAQLVMARDLDIKTILLDKPRGVVVETDDIEGFNAALKAGILTPDRYNYFVEAARHSSQGYPQVFGV